MEGKQSLGLKATILTGMLMVVLFAEPSKACAKDRECKDCILNQFKSVCPSCRPILRCLAGCLWNGVAQAKCVETCDSGKGKTRLSKCKECMRECKCSCVHSSV